MENATKFNIPPRDPRDERARRLRVIQDYRPAVTLLVGVMALPLVVSWLSVVFYLLSESESPGFKIHSLSSALAGTWGVVASLRASRLAPLACTLAGTLWLVSSTMLLVKDGLGLVTGTCVAIPLYVIVVPRTFLAPYFRPRRDIADEF